VRVVLRGSTVLFAYACACWALLALRVPDVAHAYEDQITLGVGLGYANAVSDSLPQHGALLDVSSSIGLSNVWSIRGRLSYAVHPDDSPLQVGLIGAELLYLIDVVEVVPYFGIGVDGVGRVRHRDLSTDVASHVVVGIDYLASRGITLGLDVRALALWTALEHDPLYIAATASVIWMFSR
jgi:hypothetical protein